MKLFNLQLKKEKIPSKHSLRPLLFNTEKYWFLSLGVFLLLFVITAFVGFKMFYYLYSESYKQNTEQEESGGVLNINRLKNAVKERNDFINQEIILPRDPSKGGVLPVTSTPTSTTTVATST